MPQAGYSKTGMMMVWEWPGDSSSSRAHVSSACSPPPHPTPRPRACDPPPHPTPPAPMCRLRSRAAGSTRSGTRACPSPSPRCGPPPHPHPRGPHIPTHPPTHTPPRPHPPPCFVLQGGSKPPWPGLALRSNADALASVKPNELQSAGAAGDAVRAWHALGTGLTPPPSANTCILMQRLLHMTSNQLQ